MLIAVVHLKGGSGKSTLAINLAAAAFLDGLRVLLIDLDVQGTALKWGGKRPEGSPLEEIGVVKLDRDDSLARLRPITRDYDVVLLDAPARDAKITEAAATVADAALIPLQPGAPDFWARTDTCEAIDGADVTRKLRGKIRIPRYYVINRAVAGSRIERSAQTELLTSVGEYAGTVHQRLVFGEATAIGESVLTIKPAAPEAAYEIRRLWRGLREKHVEKHPAIKSRRKARSAQE